MAHFEKLLKKQQCLWTPYFASFLSDEQMMAHNCPSDGSCIASHLQTRFGVGELKRKKQMALAASSKQTDSQE